MHRTAQTAVASKILAILSRENSIRIRGARTHNLQNVDLDIPRGRLVVLSGVSGSGKSSLAFDTLFVEGQRRYLETLSATTRQFLDKTERPDVDDIAGLPPTLAVEQRAGAIQARSTLATLTQIHDFLRVFYARAGTLHCPHCGRAVSQQSTQAIVDGILALEAGRRVMILAPLIRGRKGKHRDVFERIVREGFVRMRVDGVICDAATAPELNKAKPHTIEAVIDRIVVKEGLRARLQESVELALKHGEGKCLISHEAEGAWHDRLFSTRFSCPDCELSFPDVEPRTFSFNSPYGACPTCQGFGALLPPLARGGRGGRAQTAIGPAATDEPTPPAPPCKGGEARIERRTSNVERPTSNVQRSTSNEANDEIQSAIRNPQSAIDPPPAGRTLCPDCLGARLGPIGRSVRVGGISLPELSSLTVADAERRVEQLRIGFSEPAAQQVAARIVPEIAKRLHCLARLGLDYLSLDRPVETLSGGEHRRARLAACLGSGLRNVCYILDEPTIGLHPRDSQKLLETICELRDQGNSVVVVEHDLEFIRQADDLIDIGPGAGRHGGRIIAQGTPAEVTQDAESVTGRYLRATEQSVVACRSADSSTKPEAASWLTLAGASSRNLHTVSVRFPLGALTCVTGVSGSGKSSLVIETLVPLIKEVLAERERERFGESAAASTQPSAWVGTGELNGAELSGFESIQRLVQVDQSPLGRNARSNPATASGIWDAIRRVFARTRAARVRGFRASRFSFNAKGGRCETCHGLGVRRIGMHFLPEVEIVCPVCRGARFNRQTLEVKFRDKSVADVLAMPIVEAAGFFGNFTEVRATLDTFLAVGLGYLTLGQSAATLSGGEAQRIRLATELSRPGTGHTLYVLDEPATGLHAADIERLLQLLRSLVQQGHTVVVIEHDLDLIAAADWVIDLGPEGGAAGGQVVAMGAVAEIAAAPESQTGRALIRRRRQ